MRNKKLIFVAVLVVITTVLVCAFAGCKHKDTPAEILLSFYDDAKPSVNKVELTNLKDYSISQTYGEVVVARKAKTEGTGYTYMLFNIKDNKVIANSENNFGRTIDGVYATYNDVEDERFFTFYDKDGKLKDSAKQGEFQSSGGNTIVFSDDTVIVSTIKGVKVLELSLENANDFAYYCTGGYDLVESGDFTIAIKDNVEFAVFDKDYKYIYSSDFAKLVSADSDEYAVVNLGKGKFVIQVNRVLSEVEAQSGFTYVNEDVYYSMSTYIYDISSKKLSAIDFNKFNKIIVGQGNTNKDESYVTFAVYDIRAKRLQNPRYIVCDNSLEVKVELDEFVDNAVMFTPIDASTFAIVDDINYTIHVFNEKGEEITSYMPKGLDATYSGLFKLGNKFYDEKGNQVFKLSNDMEYNDMASDGLIYYVQEKDGVQKVCVFDSKSNTTTTYDYENFDIISENIFSVSDSDGNITLYSVYDGKAISDKKFTDVRTKESGDYTIIIATDSDENLIYFSYRVAEPEN